MGGPGFAPDATIALPTARIAVMGPEAAVNAVYANKSAAIEDEAAREQFVQDRRREYEADVDLERLVADLVLDQVIEADALRAELLLRLRYASHRERHFATKRRDVPPV
jgi:acetyl-CoA carboxylase carboxyltransferase component